VKDDSGGIIPGAAITLANESGTVSDNQGGERWDVRPARCSRRYVFVTATYKGLQQAAVLVVNITAGQPASGNIVMTPQTQKKKSRYRLRTATR